MVTMARGHPPSHGRRAGALKPSAAGERVARWRPGGGLDAALRAARRLDATAVMVNDHTAFGVDWMPFGGRRASGLGMGGMASAVEEMTRLKMIVLRER